MKKNNWVLIAFVVILIGAAFIGIDYDNISGQAVKSSSKIVLKPNPVKAGDTLYITIDTVCNYGVNDELQILDYNGNVIRTFRIKDVPRYSRNTDGEFRVPTRWQNGIYTLRGFDYCSDRYIDTQFRVS